MTTQQTITGRMSAWLLALLAYLPAWLLMRLAEILLQGRHDALASEVNARRRLDMRTEIKRTSALLHLRRCRCARLLNILRRST